MLCAISGESPNVPVASQKSGNVFERRLIEAHIAEHGTDPVTGDGLVVEDLIELKSAQIPKPRPPTHTSIPSLLSTFQNEWDALALETYNLRDHLEKTRRELSSALFQHDAAIRTIDRLTRERDEARDALSKVTVTNRGDTNGDAMQVDGQELSGELATKVTATQEKLAKTRRKRPVPENWATGEMIEQFKPIGQVPIDFEVSTSIAMDATGGLALLGGAQQSSGIFSIDKEVFLTNTTIEAGNVTATAWAGTRAVVGTDSGEVVILENGESVTQFHSHEGKVAGLSMHPSGELLASIGVDKSYVIYDLASQTQAAKVFTDAVLTTGAFHPDGHLLAVGGTDGQIRVFDIKSNANAATFDGSGLIAGLSFSENGIWLAAAAEGSSIVSIWDLRKLGQIKVIDFGSPAKTVQWDYTGQFLAIGGPSGIAIQQYSKASKEWSEIMRSALPAVSVSWGNEAKRLIVVDAEKSISILGSK